MKKWTKILIVTTLLITTLAACGKKKETSTDSGDKLQKIVVGSMGSDAQIWKFIAKSDEAKEAGLNIEVKEIDGGLPMNTATADGTVDVNAFQTYGYMAAFNEESGSDLVPIATTYMEPMGIYSGKYKKVSEVPDGAVVAIADNPSNTARALKLVASAGLITLKDDFSDAVGSTTDIKSNPKKLNFKLIDDTTGPRILNDVDLVCIGNTIAMEGGLNVLKDAVYYEKVDDSTRGNINILVAKKENADKPAFKKLGELYHSEAVKKYVDENFDGTKIDVDKPVSYVIDNK